MTLTLTRDNLIQILKDAWCLMDIDPDLPEHGFKHLVDSCKVGEDAVTHTGSQVAAYFCTESTIFGSFYYDWPQGWNEFQDHVNNGLKRFDGDFFVEPINNVEFGIYE